MRSGLYRVLWACALGLHKAGNAFVFIAAGLLRRDELRAAGQEEWSTFNPSAADVDSGLTPDECQFYVRFLRRSDRVLLVGCGTGRDLLALRSMNYDVTGLEQIPAVAESARGHLARRGIEGTVQTGFIQTAELNGTYDAVIFSNGCYSYLHHSRERVKTLARIKAHLSADGRVLFSYLPFKRQSQIGRWLTRLAAVLGRTDWVPEPGDIFSAELTTGVIRYEHDFEPHEFARECASAGLQVVSDVESRDLLRFAVATRIASRERGSPENVE
jgi:SAM-dependent methyltransferase